ncbi:MAG: TetR-like C-terminal domain-containing protein [Ancrocorticia sp.]|uniref:TetR/AcrR family transcriptional regulator n=1 Tax=Ancrocorticia sp. TaxID=2593684 RepID=UPI003F931E7B
MTYRGSANTKHALGGALKEQLETRPLAKVTVSSLAHQTGITRQAFYYHFADVYELAIWVFEMDIANHVMSHASYSEWADGFKTMLLYMQTHRDQVHAVVNSLSHRRLERFFYETLRAMMEAIVAELEGHRALDPADRAFIIDHFTLTVLGHVLHWVADDLAADPVQLVDKLATIMHGHVSEAIDRFADPQLPARLT